MCSATPPVFNRRRFFVAADAWRYGGLGNHYLNAGSWTPKDATIKNRAGQPFLAERMRWSETMCQFARTGCLAKQPRGPDGPLDSQVSYRVNEAWNRREKNAAGFVWPAISAAWGELGCHVGRM